MENMNYSRLYFDLIVWAMVEIKGSLWVYLRRRKIDFFKLFQFSPWLCCALGRILFLKLHE